ncbi:hypothetical protein OESDEN_01513 [Oesophagostomum dentatum]|uniref:Uncharacterized protein n=1 Tax=Oesophagostomum dentatum TaxID=61180 RepID=A0A0B1TQV0_OESDE|nr:hypothetical protein OESDEN_01513 [Oesophagostomum dentatum]
MARISFLRRVRSKPVAEVSPIHQVCHSSSVELEDSPPDFEAELDRLRQTARWVSTSPKRQLRLLATVMFVSSVFNFVYVDNL